MKLYAIEQISRRRLFDPETVSSVVRSSYTDMREWSRYQISFLEQAPDSVYFSSLRQLIAAGDEFQKIASLSSLLKTPKVTPSGYFDQIGEFLPQADSYQLVDLFLRLMEQKNPESDFVTEKSFSLLNKNILIGRRVFWFLSKQKLSSKQEVVLAEFKAANDEYF